MKLSKIACVIFGVFMTLAVMNLQYGNPPIDSAQYIIDNAVNQTGALNIVTSIVIDYRGYDTLGEATIMFSAVVATYLIIGRKDPK